ncbi:MULTISPECIES: V-type ATP synthase subunit I [Eisenbergiella]|uniref:ATPase n=1 Tax=Eisenbergiella porci TaxID=2652274 RepID=A0A6N7W1T2_9FIRM|nr:MULTISPECIES: V-type ATPase 116kDa subunit family protein [Eisenbergiella]MDY2651135.1 V-type ATPase 116kDa subunit family protein [Eisenbergiella porci]MSS89211.1 ATPase [Eisenbergiella porci]
MVEKMKFISIVGPKEEIDRVTSQYLSRYEIQLENTLSELKDLKNITPCADSNPYRGVLARAEELAGRVREIGNAAPSGKRMETQAAVALTEELYAELEKCRAQKSGLEAERKKVVELLVNIRPFQNLHYDVASILHFKHIKFRFGKIPVESYSKLKEYLMDDICTIFDECGRDENYIWGVYFVPAAEEEKVDAVYASLHFERTFIDDDYEGTVEEAFEALTRRQKELEESLAQIENSFQEKLMARGGEMLAAAESISDSAEYFDVRRLAAFTKAKDTVFFILCGWMTREDAERFEKEIEGDADVFCMVEDGKNESLENRFRKPPTKLKNPRIFKPFEMFIRMYGLPNYQEFDPTIFVAVTYSIIFGAMFGDVGQGLCLFIGGMLLYKFKKLNLAAIVGSCGIFSTIFGFCFGSVFGFEDVIEPLWLRPTEAMTTLPFIGNLNTVFVVAVALGMGLVILMMVFHIINSLRAKQLGEALFDTNGVAGLVFYGAVAAVVVLYMTGNALPAGIVLVVMFVVPLLVIACKEPLTNKLNKKKELIEGGKGMFVVQAFFEMFEVLLSYFSNTLSFVRIGAFAVSHAAMMQVVMMLAGAENGGTPNIIVVIIGNLIVLGMEGLIVGIQGLRLQYYEFFSRFYKGDGREFKPYAKAAKSS